MDEKEKLLSELACFGCKYREECDEEFDRSHSYCDDNYKLAEKFAIRTKLVS